MRVRPVTAASTASTACWGDSKGNGTLAFNHLRSRPRRRHRGCVAAGVVLVVGDHDLVAGLEGGLQRPAAHAFTPVVALFTNTSPASSPPTKVGHRPAGRV